MTQSLPEVIEIIKRNVSAKAVILEGEVIALDNAGYPILFQHLMCRFKRLHGIGDMALKIPLALYILMCST